MARLCAASGVVGYANGVTPDRFWSKVDKSGDNGCWNWTAFKHPRGYGAISVAVNGKPFPRPAHRVAWVMENGEVPKGLLVLHRCDNRACVNPSHLFLGTAKENSADMVAKGRQNKGSSRPKAKLTEAKVKIIRYIGGRLPQKRLAEEFGVSSSVIQKILDGKTWSHVEVVS